MKKFMFALVLFWPLSAWAGDLFSEPCAQAGIPEALAIAIARQESSLNPWAINIQGKSFFPSSRKEAEKLVMQAVKAGKFFDIGLMQINSSWLRRWNLNPLEVLEPKNNVKIGIKILKQEIDRYGYNWKSIGKYHSPHNERGRQYAWSIYKHLKRYNHGKKTTPEGQKEKYNYWNENNRIRIWRNTGVLQKGRIINF